MSKAHMGTPPPPPPPPDFRKPTCKSSEAWRQEPNPSQKPALPRCSSIQTYMRPPLPTGIGLGVYCTKKGSSMGIEPGGHEACSKHHALKNGTAEREEGHAAVCYYTVIRCSQPCRTLAYSRRPASGHARSWPGAASLAPWSCHSVQMSRGQQVCAYQLWVI